MREIPGDPAAYVGGEDHGNSGIKFLYKAEVGISGSKRNPVVTMRANASSLGHYQWDSCTEIKQLLT